MLFDLAIIGFGVIGVETLCGIKKVLLQRKQKNKINAIKDETISHSCFDCVCKFLG